VNRGTFPVDKFVVEAKSLGIHLSADDLEMLEVLFENKRNYNKLRKMAEIDYDLAIKHIVPVLSKL